MQKLRTFVKTYKQFSFVVLTALTGLALDLSGRDTIAHWLMGSTCIAMALPMLVEMYRSVRAGQYGVDILAVTAIVSAVIAGEYWAAIIIVVMLTGGEALEDYAERRAKRELTSLIDNAPKMAHKLSKNGDITDVDVHSVKVGDLLIVRPGEVVPVDCSITEGRSSFDESSITGESLPVTRGKNQEVLSGSLNMEGAVTVKAVRSARESQYEQIVELVEKAAESQAPFVRIADQYSIPFTIFAYVIAGCAWYAWGDFTRFVGVLVVATPCPLLLGAPIALISGMSRAAKNGIIIKSGTALEKLASIKSIAFDKTGTLTTGELTVTEVLAFGEHKKDEVLALAASLEQRSVHTMAAAIVGQATSKKLKLLNVKSVREESGLGVSGVINGKEVRVGKRSFVEAKGAELPANIEKLNAEGSQVWVGIGKDVAGVVLLEDTVRPESKETIAKIRKLGITSVRMLTGDVKATAYRIAKSVGIEKESVLAECLPADKLVAVHTTHHSQRPVAMVGDGVNDAPVLTAADVGIALGARGSTAASQTADVVIMVDDLSRVYTALWIARRTFSIARQAILIGIALSVILMFYFAVTETSPAIGASLQELIDVSVIIWALRAHGPWGKSPSKLLKDAQKSLAKTKQAA